MATVVRLAPAVDAHVKAYAATLGLSFNALVTVALIEYMQAHPFEPVAAAGDAPARVTAPAPTPAPVTAPVTASVTASTPAPVRGSGQRAGRRSNGRRGKRR